MRANRFILFGLVLIPLMQPSESRATLVSYYDFDDGATVSDQVGANDGTVISDAGFSSDTPDGSPNSLDLTGAFPQDYVRIGAPSPNGPDFNIGTTNSFTISMWVNYTASERGIVTIRQDLTSGGGDRSGLTFGINSSNAPFVGMIPAPGTDFRDITTNQTVPTSTWTHMAATYDGTTDTLAVYVDGTAATVFNSSAAGSPANDGSNATGGAGAIDFDDPNGSFTGFGAAGNAPQHASSAGDFTRLFYDGLLDDVAIWDEALAASDIALLAAGTKPPALVADADGDGMPDEYENQFPFLDSNDDADASLDEDGDGLTNLRECQLGTAPDDPDSDDDGLDDRAEVEDHATDPLAADSDGDGADDRAEIETHMTDPNDEDSDDDTILDGEEVVAGDDGFITDPNEADSDEDTFTDEIEIAFGTDPNDPNDFPRPPGEGLISYYNFDDGTTVTDQVGPNHGTVISNAGFSNDTPDGSPNALDLSGSAPQDYVRLGPASPEGPDFGIGETNSFTVSMWVNYTASERGIVTIRQDLTGGGGDRSGITIGIGPGGSPFVGLIVSTGDEGGDAANSGATFRDVQTELTVPTDQWAHLAATYDSASDTLAIYVDGTAATTYTDGNGGSSLAADGTNLTGGLGLVDFNDPNGSFTGLGASGNGPAHGSSAGDFTRLFYDGLLDEVGIWNVALPAEDIALLADGTPPPAPARGRRLPLSVERIGNEVVLKWPSQGGRLYRVRSVTDPTAPIPPETEPPASTEWPVFAGNEDLAATPPENTLAVAISDPERYFVVEEYPAPPESVFFDDFEAGQNAWTTGTGPDHMPGTEWEFGTPSDVGPPAAKSGTNCFGTNLSANYTEDALVFLRSPAVDLTTAEDATLNFAQWVDIEEFFDFGRVNLLDADDGDALIAVLEMAIDGENPTEWTRFSKSLPAAALGKNVKFEFLLDSDDFDLDPSAGWYIDDVNVTVP